MKFSDLDKNLVTEAEAFDKTQGKMSRMGTKLKSKLGPTKGMRQRATGKAQIQQQALDIKSEYMEYVGANDLDMTAGTLKQFLSDNNYENLAKEVDEVAVKLKFKQKEVEKPQAQPADAEKAEVVTGDEEQEDMVSPEEMTGEKPSGEQSEEEIRAAYAKQGEEAEAEAKELGAEEDEVEEEVDMSASIYESRLAYFLIEEMKLKDNQLDTLLVRVLQAAGAGGKKASTDDSEQTQAEPDEKPEKKDSLLKKAGKAYRKGMDKANKAAFGDLVGGSEEEEVTDSGKVKSTSGMKYIDSGDYSDLTELLNKIVNTKRLEPNDQRRAKELLNNIQYANKE